MFLDINENNNLINNFWIFILLLIFILFLLTVYLAVYLKYQGSLHVKYNNYTIKYDYDLEKNYKIISKQNFIILKLKLKILVLKIPLIFKKG